MRHKKVRQPSDTSWLAESARYRMEAEYLRNGSSSRHTCLAVFLAGKKCIPVNDRESLELSVSRDEPLTIEGMRKSIKLDKAWIGGWTIASLKDTP